MSIRLHIHGLDEHGAGIATLRGRTIHVAGSLAGEEVLAQVEHRSPHRPEDWARLVRVKTPSPDRVRAACAHHGDCGGCPLMHLGYEAQLRAKEERIRRALPSVPVAPIVPARTTLGYRNTAKYVVVRRGGRTVMGSYAPRTHRVADMSSCLVARPPIPQIAAEIVHLCDEGAPLPRYVVIRVDRGRAHVGLVAWQEDPRFAAMARELRRRRPEVAGATLYVNPSEGNVILDGKELALDGAPLSLFRFRQANDEQAERLYADVVEAAGAAPRQRAFDLYCGAGAIASRLAAAHPGLDIVAVDRVDAEPRGARFVRSDVGSFLADAPPVDVVIVNPPRKGLGRAVSHEIARLRPERLLYVSCMVETLARDVSLLEPHLVLESVRPYDLLPQTPHVEVLAVLSRRT